jgi:uncharacterized protein (TIGR03067 family)
MSHLGWLAAMALALHGAGPPPPGASESEVVRQELARFQGTWQLVRAESNGEKVPEERVRQVRVTITGNTHTVRFGDQVVVHDVSFAIDPTKTPREVTDTINDGPNKGKQILGIYALEGDTLTSCVAPIGKDRPAEFGTVAGSGHTLRVFRRVKAEETGNGPPATREAKSAEPEP